MSTAHSADGSCGPFPNCRTFTLTGRQRYLQALTVHSSSDPHSDSLRAICGSRFAASGQNLPRAAALQAAFPGAWGWSANPRRYQQTKEDSLHDPFSAEIARRTGGFRVPWDYGKAGLVLSSS
jgi:hypothetical protein